MFDLSKEFASQLEARLRQGQIEGLGADVAVLKAAETTALTSKANKKAATKSQNQVQTICWQKASNLRKAIRNHVEDKALQKSFGIGEKLNQGSAVSIKAAAKLLIDASKEYPETARSAGILPEDLAELQQLTSGLTGLDVTQGVKQVTAKNVTAERNAAHLRIEKALTRIGTISEIVFEGQPEVLARFRSAMPSTRKRKASEPKPAKPSEPKPVKASDPKPGKPTAE